MTLGPQDLWTVGALAAITFLIGLLIGFIGAGGAGVTVAILTTVFGMPVHTAIGTAIAAMLFVTVSGAISHFREGNVDYRLGLVVGLAGAAGAVFGADISQAVSERVLGVAAGLALWSLAFFVWLRTRITSRVAAQGNLHWHENLERSPRQWAAGVGLGATGGAAAAFFGVAMARHGDVSLPHLIGLTIGLGSGAYIGARFTRRASRQLLRGTVVAIPFLAGAMLVFL